MKKKKFNKKLSLNKEIISNLDKIKGGGGIITVDWCPTDLCDPTVPCPTAPNCETQGGCTVPTTGGAATGAFQC